MTAPPSPATDTLHAARLGTVVVVVPGMSCRHDVRTVSACVADVEGAVTLRVDQRAKTVVVHGDVSGEAMAAAVAAAGYAISGVP